SRDLFAAAGGPEHPLDVAGDEIDLEVDLAADLHVAQARALHRVRDQVDAELARRLRIDDAVDGEGDAVDRNRALHGEKAGEIARRFDAQLPRLADALEMRNASDAVDVAADEM